MERTTKPTDVFVLVYHKCYDKFLTDNPYRIYSEWDYIWNGNNSMYEFVISGTYTECQRKMESLLADRYMEYDYQETFCKEMNHEA